MYHVGQILQLKKLQRRIAIAKNHFLWLELRLMQEPISFESLNFSDDSHVRTPDFQRLYGDLYFS